MPRELVRLQRSWRDQYFVDCTFEPGDSVKPYADGCSASIDWIKVQIAFQLYLAVNVVHHLAVIDNQSNVTPSPHRMKKALILERPIGLS